MRWHLDFKASLQNLTDNRDLIWFIASVGREEEIQTLQNLWPIFPKGNKKWDRNCKYSCMLNEINSKVRKCKTFLFVSGRFLEKCITAQTADTRDLWRPWRKQRRICIACPGIAQLYGFVSSLKIRKSSELSWDIGI